MASPEEELGPILRVGRIVSEFLDNLARTGDVRAEEATILERHPTLARELKEQFAVIRRLRFAANPRIGRGRSTTNRAARPKDSK